MMEFFICCVGYVVQVMGVLVAVAFYTLYERKLLSYSQLRVGPNKVSFMGMLQPMADAVKLFSKEVMLPYKSMKLIYVVSPLLTIFVSLVMWVICPYWFSGVEFSLGWFVLFCGMALNVMLTFMSGWSSNSKYSVLGSFRAVAQMISNEVVMSFVVMMYALFVGGYMLNSYNEPLLFVLFYPLGMLWFVMSLSESQRTPFDLAEGESELVSGFNTEYSAVNFALLFLGEYASILLVSFVSTILMFGLGMNSIIFFVSLYLMFSLFLWCRSTFPRIRYDYLMMYVWKHILLSLLILLLVGLVLKILVF